jgi:TetR/AcrR family transcriptional regulator
MIDATCGRTRGTLSKLIRSYQSVQNASNGVIAGGDGGVTGPSGTGKTAMKLDNTRSNLLRAAIFVFGRHGYAGGSVRQIAERANSNIGAIKYHYGSKEKLWQAVVTHLFRELGEYIMRDASSWPGVSARERVVNATRNYIHFCAKRPELNRIILSEAIRNGSRMQWLAENHLKIFIERSAEWMALAQADGIYPKDVPVLNLVVIAMSVSQYLFLMAPFVENALGIDVFDSVQIENHVDAVVSLLLAEGRN